MNRKCPKCGGRLQKEFDIGHLRWVYICFECGFYIPEEVMDSVEGMAGENETKYYYNQLNLRTSRKELVKTLLEKYKYGIITEDCIMDEMIDIEIYNTECEKRRNKE